MPAAPQSSTPFFPVDRAEWLEQKRRLEERIGEHHRALERSENMALVAFLQGQIAELRWLLDGTAPEQRVGVGHAKYQ